MNSQAPNTYEKIRQWLKVDLKLSRKGIILVFVPMAFVLIIMGCLAALLNQAELDVWRQTDSRAIITKANAISRDFIAQTTGGQKPTDRLNVVNEIEALKVLTIDNPTQSTNVANLEQIVNRGLYLRDKKNIDIKPFLDQLNTAVMRIEDEEEEELNKSILKSSTTRSAVRQGLYLGVALNTVLALAMAIYFSKGITQRLALVFENSKRLAKGMPLLPLQAGRDEIARLDLVFHTMAERLAEMTHKQKALTDNAIDVIFTVDNNGHFSMINNACLDAWGYAPEELMGQSITKVLHEADKALTMVLINKLIKGAFSRSFETRLMRKDGKTIDLLWSATWSNIEQCLFCVAHDITQRKEVERLKHDFFTMISHDLRTPLTSILFSLNIAAKRIENLTGLLAGRQAAEVASELTEELKASERNCAQLLKLIDGLLVIEKIESGQIELSPKMFKLTWLIKRAEDSVSALAKQKEMKLVSRFEEAVLAADEDRLLQVLVNLLGNAIKFSPCGSQVTLLAAVSDSHLTCQVEDEGPGIALEYQETIFDRYKQVKIAGVDDKSGTGLGLAICRAIIKAHNGEIGVISKEGLGSKFWFKIPVITLNQQEEDKTS